MRTPNTGPVAPTGHGARLNQLMVNFQEMVAESFPGRIKSASSR